MTDRIVVVHATAAKQTEGGGEGRRFASVAGGDEVHSFRQAQDIRQLILRADARLSAVLIAQQATSQALADGYVMAGSGSGLRT